MSTSKPNPKSFVPGRRPWFQALRFAVACAGVGVTGSIVGLVWPSPDQVAVDQAPLMGNPWPCWLVRSNGDFVVGGR